MVDIRAEQIGAIYAKQRKDGLASWTISGTNTILSAVFSFALSRGYIASNPLHRLDKIEKPKQVSEKEAHRLSEQEVQAICDAAIDTYRPIVTTPPGQASASQRLLGFAGRTSTSRRRRFCPRPTR